MATMTLEQLHEDMIEIKKDLQYIKETIDENLQITEDVKQDIQESRTRNKQEFISQEEMKNEFG